MLDLSTDRVYKPVQNSRKPEIYAWLLFVAITTLLVAIPNSGFLRIAGILLMIFFLFSAIAMSIGNWMNRNTKLKLTQQGVVFENALQTVDMGYKNISRVEVHSRRVNDKIIVVGDNERSFGFDLYNEIFLNNKSGGAVGFRDGELILETILYYAELDKSRKKQAEGYYYFDK